MRFSSYARSPSCLLKPAALRDVQCESPSKVAAAPPLPVPLLDFLNKCCGYQMATYYPVGAWVKSTKQDDLPHHSLHEFRVDPCYDEPFQIISVHSESMTCRYLGGKDAEFCLDRELARHDADALEPAFVWTSIGICGARAYPPVVYGFPDLATPVAVSPALHRPPWFIPGGLYIVTTEDLTGYRSVTASEARRQTLQVGYSVEEIQSLLERCWIAFNRRKVFTRHWLEPTAFVLYALSGLEIHCESENAENLLMLLQEEVGSAACVVFTDAEWRQVPI